MHGSVLTKITEVILIFHQLDFNIVFHLTSTNIIQCLLLSFKFQIFSKSIYLQFSVVCNSGDAKFVAATYRLFKIPQVNKTDGSTVTYKGML